jgi:hypothetical protein
MNTSNYLIEYLVAGTLTIFWGFLLFIGLAGIKWLELISYQDLSLFKGDNLLALSIMLFPLIYVTGIVIDRFIAQIFDHFFKSETLGNIIHSYEEYNEYVTKIYLVSSELSQNYQSMHMRIRIVRTASFSSVMTIICLHIFIWNSGIFNHPEILGFVFDKADFEFWQKDIILLTTMLTIFLLVATISSFRAWRNLIETEYKLLKDRYKCICKHEKQLNDREDNSDKGHL